MKLNKRKRFDLWVLAALIVAAAWCSVAFRLDIVLSFLLYLALPALYLCLRERKNYLKVLLGSTVLTLFGVSLDVIAEFNHAWLVPIHYPFLSYLVWGFTPVALVIWGFCVAFLTLIFWEHFLDDEKHAALSKHFTYALIPCVWAFFSIGVLALYAPNLLSIPYAYLLLIGIAELPLLWVLVRRPKLFHKILILAGFFFILNFIFELTALSLDQWQFPGQYIGWISILTLRFPLEEMILWIALSSPIAVFYYEEFVDDGK